MTILYCALIILERRLINTLLKIKINAGANVYGLCECFVGAHHLLRIMPIQDLACDLGAAFGHV